LLRLTIEYLAVSIFTASKASRSAHLCALLVTV